MKIILEKLIIGKVLGIGENRFNYKVKIKNQIHDCYAASTSHLSNYVNINNINCLLMESNSKSKYPYTLIAVEHNNHFLLVNFNMISNFFKIKFFNNAKKEKIFFNNYKADLFIESTGSILEIKAILNSKSKQIIYPDISSLRAHYQIKQLLDLSNEYDITLIFCILSINNDFINFSDEYKRLLNDLMKKGANIKFYQLYINKNHEVVIEPSFISSNL